MHNISLLGILPSVFVYRIQVADNGFRKEFLSRIKLMILTTVSIALVVFILGGFYASFIREYNTN